MAHNAILVLEDGTTFHGQSIGVNGSRVGEVVFNTSICGYQEILTDPSYSKQIVTLTYPHIGNVGTNNEDNESNQTFCSGLVIKDLPSLANNWRNQETLPDFLKRNNVVAIANIDTRKLTRHIRIHGAQKACIVGGEKLDVERALVDAKSFAGLSGMDLAKEVTTQAPYEWNQGTWLIDHGFNDNTEKKYKVVAIDFGIKHNILRILAQKGCDITVVPAKTTADEILSHQPDGLFLSNGPGDPEPCDYAIEAIQKVLDKGLPIFGICLGHQLLALASGAKTEKMKFGHHGANHPVQDLDNKKVYITSQNHGFTVQENSLGDLLRVTHKSLFDNTIQGIERTDKPAFSFQGHPEASPGPMDIEYLFDRFIDLMQAHKS